MSDSVRPHGLQPTRLLRPWDSPGKNTGVGCHFLLQCMKVKSESRSVKWLSCVRLLPTPWTAAYQTPPSMGFSRQEYWSRVPFTTLRTKGWGLHFKTCTLGIFLQLKQTWNKNGNPETEVASATPLLTSCTSRTGQLFTPGYG